MNHRMLIILLVQLLLSISNPTLARSCDVRGVAERDCQKYTGAEGLYCPTTNQVIPPELVNDNYCDCPRSQVSDEPGTSACSDSRFHCENVGSFPRDIRSSIVNDGICDCCDGTDEWLSPGLCGNECAKEARQTYQSLQKELADLENALTVRDQLVRKAREVIKAKEAHLQALEAEIPDLQALKNQQEEVKKAAQDLKEEAEKQWFAIRDKNKAQEGDDDYDEDLILTDEDLMLDDDEDFPYPEEYKFMSEEEKEMMVDDMEGHDVESFPYPEEYKLKTEDESLDTSVSPEETEKSEEAKEEQTNCGSATGTYLDSCRSCEQTGCSLKCRCSDGTGKFIRTDIDLSTCDEGPVENKLGNLKCISEVSTPFPPECRPKGTYMKSCKNCAQEGCNLTCECDDGDKHKLTSLDLLSCDKRVFVNNKQGELQCVSPPDGMPRTLDKENNGKGLESEDTPKKTNEKTAEEKLYLKTKEDFQNARSEYDDTNRKLKEKERGIEEIENFFKFDFGEDNILASFSDCLDVEIGKYTYEICAFDKVTQKEGSSSTDLGKFKELKKLENGAFEMMFDNGRSCWKGPKRSTTVELICGAQEVIERVEEPATCVYKMQLTTPTACSRTKVTELKSEMEKLASQFPNILTAKVE